MRKRLSIMALVCLSVLLVAIPIYAASSATITITESSGNSYDMIGAIAPMDNDYLVSHDFIASTGLDVDIDSLPSMLVGDRTIVATPLAANDIRLLSYTTDNDLASAFHVLTGYGGYVTVSDDATLDMKDSFIVDIKGWVNTDAGDDKNLMYREDSYVLYIQAEDTVRAAILSAGDVEDLAVTVTGVTSGVRRVVVTADGEDFIISVYNASGDLIGSDTESLGANSVPDSGNDYTFVQNNCMAYAEYIKLSTSE